MTTRILLTLALLVSPAVSWAYEPTDNYTPREIEGWKILVNNKLLKEQKKLGDKAIKLLSSHLYRIQRVVPQGALKELRKVPIWLELKNDPFPCACYHPSRQWLKANGHNPDKAGAVEIANAKTFLSWTRSQPWMVLHELAHAYHHHVLGHGNKAIKTAYQQAVKGKKYERVLHISGHTRRAYALNNDSEYFAEASEAFFGTNDFYPFVRSELKHHDPKMCAALKKLWRGKPSRHAPEEQPTAVKKTPATHKD